MPRIESAANTANQPADGWINLAANRPISHNAVPIASIDGIRNEISDGPDIDIASRGSQ